MGPRARFRPVPLLLNVGMRTANANLHVLLELVSPLQVVHVALDGPVIQAEEAVERYAKVLHELLLVGRLHHQLFFFQQGFDIAVPCQLPSTVL